MSMCLRQCARFGPLVLAIVVVSLPLVGCGGEPPPVVDVSTKGGEPGSVPTPAKSKVAITKPAK